MATIISIIATSPSAPAYARPLVIGEVFADISCFEGVTPFIRWKAWGVDGPRNTRVEVEQDVKINGERWIDQTNWVNTTSTGSYSAPTHTQFTFLEGNYDLYVYVYIDGGSRDGTYVGSAHDSCDID